MFTPITGRSVERNQKPVRYWIDFPPTTSLKVHAGLLALM